MMGRLKSDQGQLFYEFHLGDAVSEDHRREIDAALDLSLASQRTCTSLFVHGAPFDRSGTDDPDAGRGVCLCDPLRLGAPVILLACLIRLLWRPLRLNRGVLSLGLIHIRRFGLPSRYRHGNDGT
jgi:hypothetical protein